MKDLITDIKELRKLADDIEESARESGKNPYTSKVTYKLKEAGENLVIFYEGKKRQCIICGKYLFKTTKGERCRKHFKNDTEGKK